jgi:hypothetical protein
MDPITSLTAFPFQEVHLLSFTFTFTINFYRYSKCTGITALAAKGSQPVLDKALLCLRHDHSLALGSVLTPYMPMKEIMWLLLW